MPPERISVVIPCFNHEAYIAEAIYSALNQSYPITEVICVDDGSTDQSLVIASAIESDKLKIISQVNSGAAAARNNGVRVSVGNFLCFLDADDVWPLNKVEHQISQLQHSQLSFGHVQEFFDDSVQIQGSPRILPGYSPITMMLTRDIFTRVGDFNEQLAVAEFIEWLSRARQLGVAIAMNDEIYALRRIHAGNVGRSKKPNANHYAISLKAALDLKRGKST